jgi:hypothetical protein
LDFEKIVAAALQGANVVESDGERDINTVGSGNYTLNTVHLAEAPKSTADDI